MGGLNSEWRRGAGRVAAVASSGLSAFSGVRAFRASVGVMLWPRGLTRGMAVAHISPLCRPPPLRPPLSPPPPWTPGRKPRAGGHGTIRYSKSLPSSDEPERPHCTELGTRSNPQVRQTGGENGTGKNVSPARPLARSPAPGIDRRWSATVGVSKIHIFTNKQ